jgi:putative ABC transport system permease protein
MDFSQAVRLAIAGIKANKMRSFLTMLGVIIGVSTVIILVSVGQGSAKQVTGQIESLGSNLISVSIRGRGEVSGLSYQEALKLGDKPAVSGIAPTLSGSVTVKYGTKEADTTLEGTNDQYAQVRNQKTGQGRFLLPVDIDYRQKVVILGSEVSNKLFGFGSPIGQEVKINGVKFKVVGVLETKGSSMGGSSDDKVVIPITTAMRLLANPQISSISLQVKSKEDVDLAVSQLESALLRKFKDEENYRVFNQAEMLSTVNQVTGTLTMMLGGIAGVSLLVGGIGIMNIMLVSVTERTREIGIRKAIGAKRRDILRQFLVEAVVISSMGGILGILIGISGAKAIGALMKMTLVTSPQIMLLAVSFSVLVGVVFGIFPANKASRLKPIDALRFE